MSVRRSRWLVSPEGAIQSTAGCPDDGREYREVSPTSDTLGERVVRWTKGEHVFGRAVSDPTPGEHIGADLTIEQRALYWIKFVSDEDLGAYLRNDQRVVVWIRADRAWLVPTDPIPAPRSPNG